MSEFTRRDFLKIAVGVPVGIATGFVTSSEVAGEINKPFNDSAPEGLDHRPAEQVESDAPSSDGFEDRQDSLDVQSFTTTPIEEEIVFRALPGMVVDLYQRSSPQDILRNVIRGRGELGLNRREAVAGVISSLWFALGHAKKSAITGKDYFPASQFVDGIAFWLLQRNFGISSNVAAHSTHNYQLERQVEDLRRKIKQLYG